MNFTGRMNNCLPCYCSIDSRVIFTCFFFFFAVVVDNKVRAPKKTICYQTNNNFLSFRFTISSIFFFSRLFASDRKVNQNFISLCSLYFTSHRTFFHHQWVAFIILLFFQLLASNQDITLSFAQTLDAVDNLKDKKNLALTHTNETI